MIADEVKCETGTILLEEGNEADTLFLLIDGDIDISYKSEEPYYPKGSKVFHVGDVNPGELFGVSSLVDPYRYNATATSSQACQMIKFDSKALRTLSDLDCSLGYALIQQIAKTINVRLAFTRVQLAAAQT
jgi:CRP/FNR family transcriptional regulator, cyclic AMP receptor protein